MNDVMMMLKQYNCTVISQEVQLFCSITTGIPNNRVQEVVYKLKEIQGADITKS